MIFNHTINKQTLYQDALYLTGANSVTYPIVDFTRNANFALDKVISLIKRNDSKWRWSDSNTNSDIVYTDIVSGQDNYTMEVDFLKIVKVRFKKSDGNYKTLIAKDRQELDDSYIDSSGEPKYYDKEGLSLSPFPVPNYSATEGIEITYQGGPSYFVENDTTKEPGINQEFHRLISAYPALDWLISEATVRNPLTHRIKRVETIILNFELNLEHYYMTRNIDNNPTLKTKKTSLKTGTNL